MNRIPESSDTLPNWSIHTGVGRIQIDDNARYIVNPNRIEILDLAGKMTSTSSHANLILGSTECKKVVGEDMNWQIGLEVAPEINLSTFSAPIKLFGNHFSHFPVPPFASRELLIWCGLRALLRERFGLKGLQ